MGDRSRGPVLRASADLEDAAGQVLRAQFGFEGFRPGQRELIAAVLAGRDAIGVLPTGGGKSLAYQLPALVLGGTALVVSPLIALMKDQVDALERRGVRATFINSSLEPDEHRARSRAAARGAYQLVYVAPEGLEASLGDALAPLRPSLIAVDEAHCISQWGHDFRPAYRNLACLKPRFGAPVLALTATATRRVSADVAAQLSMRDPLEVRGDFFRPNLRLRVFVRTGDPSDAGAILALLRARPGQRGIVYALRRRQVEAIADQLQAAGVRALPYHAGLATDERTRTQQAFARDEVDVVVATIAFGMGIDKSDVRFVIHSALPGSIEAYCQEIGRAGRDGLPADCVLFHGPGDVSAHEWFIDRTEDPAVAARQRVLLREMVLLASGRGECRHVRLARYFGQEIGPCRTSCDVCGPLAPIPRAGVAARLPDARPGRTPTPGPSVLARGPVIRRMARPTRTSAE